MYGFVYEYNDKNGEVVIENFFSDDVTEAVDAACVTAKLIGKPVMVVAPDCTVHCTALPHARSPLAPPVARSATAEMNEFFKALFA
jgi:hypothetical protein